MRISWSWLSEFIDLSELGSPTALAELLTRRGLEVEAIERLDQGFEHVVTAQILERAPHPQADRLSICQVVTTGSGTPLEIVCGAQNMKAGDKVALAEVGAHLPNGVKISAGKIRGVVSNGMLCSEEELKLKESSEGILILPPSTELGQPLAKILGRDDTLLSLKLTANRGDCLSHFGIAREIGAAIGKAPKKPVSVGLTYKNCPISVHLEAGELAPQFYGCFIEGAKVGPSPEWLVKRLESLGSRSINNVVDASNLVMLELGHPVHVYDSKKILGQKLRVRMSQAGENLPLLDGQAVELTGSELAIADEERAIGLAGVMGGGNSEVDPSSTQLFLECAEFDPKLVRKSASRYQRKTDAAQRFEKGIDPSGLEFTLGRLTHLILELAGGKQVGATRVFVASRSDEALKVRPEVRFSKNYLNDFLGFQRDQAPLTLQKAEEILKALDCKVTSQGQDWVVVPPSYRQDLKMREDFAEEIARSLGYDLIPATVPPLSSSPVFGGSALSRVTVMDRAKESLVKSGLNEAINFSFTSRSWLSKFGLNSSAPVMNPLSAEHEVLVPSLLPGLIRNTLDNWSNHFGSEPLAIRLFELRPTFGAAAAIEAQGQMETGVEERWKLAFTLAGPRYAEALRSERGEVDFYDLKAVVDQLLKSLGSRGVRYQPLDQSRKGGNPLFHPGQSVEILAGNSVAGYFGLLHPRLAKELKARGPLWMCELDWNTLAQFSRGGFDCPTFKTWSQFPSIERDFALVVKNEVTSDKICQLALKSGKPLIKSVKVFDIYRGSQVVEGMTSVAVRVIFYDEARSLQESEAEAASARILESWKKELGAELRS
jgi:phenylalanyl-tRNA synthetase beta chain